MSSFKFNYSSFLTRLIFIFLFLNTIDYAFADEECKQNGLIPGKSCLITLNFSEKVKFSLVEVSNLKLLANDTLTVNITGKDENIDIINNGFIVLPIKAKYVFNLTLTADLGKRSYQAISATNSNALSITKLQKFTILTKGYDFKDADEINLLNNEIDDAFVLLSSDSQVKAGSFDKDEQPSDIVDLSEQDLLASKKKIKLKFVKSNNTVYNFDLVKVDKCSSVNTIDEKTNSIDLKTIDKKTAISQDKYTCVYQIKSNNNLQVDKIDLKTVGVFDEIIIKNGLKLISEDLINSKLANASNYLNRLDKIVSKGNSIMVILVSSFLQPNYEQSTVTIKKSTIVKISKEGPFTITADKETIAIFSLDDNYPQIQLPKNLNLTSINLTIYDSLDLSVEPVIRFYENQIINKEIWTDKKKIVLKFTSSSPLKVDGKLLSYKINCNKITNQPSTFILNYNENLLNQVCKFYFKPEIVGHSLLLDLENLYLNDQTSCLSLRSVNQDQELFNICNEKDAKPLEKNHLTELVLSPKDSYVLAYGIGATLRENRILVQASFTYDSLPYYRQHNLTIANPVLSVQSLNYPNNYPYYSTKFLDQINSNSYAYGSFEKYDLRSGDTLKVQPNNAFSFTSKNVDDFIIDRNASLLLGPIMSNPDIKTAIFKNSYGQGYKIDFEFINCKLELDKNGILQTPNYPAKFENATKCVAIINLFDSKKSNYLNITIENKKADGDYGNLTIYDNASRQRDIKYFYDFNVLKNNETIKLNTTSTKLVIIFDPLDKNVVNGFKLTIAKEVCPSITCDDGTRCILESIHCNYRQECIDGQDEAACLPNPDKPGPPSPPSTITIYRGISGWWITLFIIPLSMLSGALIFKHGPRMITRFRGHTYQEFNTFSENA